METSLEHFTYSMGDSRAVAKNAKDLTLTDLDRMVRLTKGVLRILDERRRALSNAQSNAHVTEE